MLVFFRNILFILLTYMLVSCSISTVFYDVNNYENGSKYSNNEPAYEFSCGFVPSFQTEQIRTDSVYSSFDKYGFVLKTKYKFAVSNDLSASLEGFAGTDFKGLYFIPLSSLGGKFYLKYPLYLDKDKFFISVMPGVGYAIGNTFMDDVDMSGNGGSNYQYDGFAKLWGIELLFPMSYKFNKNNELNFGTKFFYFNYKCPYRVNGYNKPIYTITEKYSFFSTAVYVGLSGLKLPLGIDLAQEATIMYLYSKIFISFGVAIKI